MTEIAKDMRQCMSNLEAAMLAASDGTDLDAFIVKHHFAPHVYARELFLPKDHVLVGKIHKHECLNIMVHGKIVVATEEGVKVLEGYNTFVSPPGTKRIGHVLEDTIWITIHPTEETELEKIEAEVIAPSFEALKEFQKQLGESQCLGDM